MIPDMVRYCLLIFIVFFASACNNTKTEKVNEATPSPSKYYYYPKANVYFDTVNKDYVFLSGDNNTWTTGKQIPAAMQSMMDKSILLDTFSQPVWKDNENHRLIYSAVLYASPTDTIEKVLPKPVVQSPVSGDTAKEKKEKKGLRKFLDKIFGKKKNKQNDDN